MLSFDVATGQLTTQENHENGITKNPALAGITLQNHQ